MDEKQLVDRLTDATLEFLKEKVIHDDTEEQEVIESKYFLIVLIALMSVVAGLISRTSSSTRKELKKALKKIVRDIYTTIPDDDKK